jgi:hypothetical protein
MDFLTIGQGVWFFSFLCTLYINFTVEIRKRLRKFAEIHKRSCEFEEIEISKAKL